MEIFSYFHTISQNILPFFHIISVKWILDFFVKNNRFIRFYQNIRLLQNYYKDFSQLLLVWTMWITWCITLFYWIFVDIKMWITFALKFVQNRFSL